MFSAPSSPSTSSRRLLCPPRIACFVCGAEGPADYPLFASSSSPHGFSSSSPFSSLPPHFPFLRVHPPPVAGSATVNRNAELTEARACRPCHRSLMRQWEEHERQRLPLQRRVYAIKRVDGVPFLSHEAQLQALQHMHRQQQLASINKVSNSSSSNHAISHGASSGHHGPPTTSHHHHHHHLGVVTSDCTGAPNPLWSKCTSPLTKASETLSVDSALDLSSGPRERESMRSRSSAVSALSHHSSSYVSETTSSVDVLDFTLPDKNASFEICYVCGEEFKRGLLSHTFAKAVNKLEPFYPSLLSHPRPSKSRPMDSRGRVRTCDDCHNHLLKQWQNFEEEAVPHADRNYVLRKRAGQQLTSTLDSATFVCYLCALDYQSSSLHLLYARPNMDNEPYYPFIELQRPPPGASPISPQGMVQVCTLCYKSTKEKHHGFMKADQPPPKKRRGNSFSLIVDAASNALNNNSNNTEDDEKHLPADVTCLLCRRKFAVGSFKMLNTQPSSVCGTPFFPFLSELAQPDNNNELCNNDEELSKTSSGGRVRACESCFTSLLNQWSAFQRDKVAIEERQYKYASQVTGPRSVSSIRAMSPSSQRSLTPIKNAIEINNSNALPIRSRSNTLESRPRSTSNPQSPVGSSLLVPAPTCQSPAVSNHSAGTESAQAKILASNTSSCSTLQQSGSGSNSSSFYCFLCGLHSDLSFSRMLYSSAPGKKAPFFPFMKHHVPKARAETLREDGTALVCTFCYHSVMLQWNRYNDSKPFVEPERRSYNLNDYLCYVCAIATYRKRIRALRVLDFPFLRHHRASKNGVSLENGEMVAVCLDCYDSLRLQFTEGERYGIPVEKRQYNWMQIPRTTADHQGQQSKNKNNNGNPIVTSAPQA